MLRVRLFVCHKISSIIYDFWVVDTTFYKQSAFWALFCYAVTVLGNPEGGHGASLLEALEALEALGVRYKRKG